MKIRFIICTLISMLCLLPMNVHGQNAEEKIVEFFSDNATMEDNPKQHTYNITIFSPDGEWKMQLNYHANSMFGTFGNDDFDLGGSGKNYNYARNPKNDMVFYSFTDMQVSVADEGTLYRVHANCLANNRTRFVVEATIAAPQPEETRTDNLGYARLEPNPFYGTWTIYAENDNYKLGYGVTGDQLLGTFYRADMLMPELYDKQAGRNVKILTATALHTQDGDNTNFHIDILGDDLVLYALDMYNGPYELEITGERTIDIPNMVLQDLTEMYGCYQWGGMNDEYGLALAVKPEVMNSGRTTWTRDDLIMQYTRLVTLPDEESIDIFDIKAQLEQTEDVLTLHADVTAMDGTLYHVNMHTDVGDYIPQAQDTVNIDFGHVSMIDYTQGVGTVGFGAVSPGRYQMRFYVNTHTLDGTFVNEDFNMDMCDVMVVTGDTYVFHDGEYMRATMENVDGRLRITADMLCVDNVLYHATMYVDSLRCLQGGQYAIDMDEGVDMVSVLMGTDDYYSEYMLQFQKLDEVFDQNQDVVADGYYFSFYLGHQGPGVSGEYGYSAGTLAEDVNHLFYENHCEVRVAPVAGTLTLEPLETVTIGLGTQYAKTCVYRISFQLLGQNGAIYTAQGSNFLICIDEDGRLVNIDESASAIIQQQLEDRGYPVRKVLRDGRVILDTPAGQYDLQGRKLKKIS